jgi:hypothetical protein
MMVRKSGKMFEELPPGLVRSSGNSVGRGPGGLAASPLRDHERVTATYLNGVEGFHGAVQQACYPCHSRT